MCKGTVKPAVITKQVMFSPVSVSLLTGLLNNYWSNLVESLDIIQGLVH